MLLFFRLFLSETEKMLGMVALFTYRYWLQYLRRKVRENVSSDIVRLFCVAGIDPYFLKAFVYSFTLPSNSVCLFCVIFRMHSFILVTRDRIPTIFILLLP